MKLDDFSLSELSKTMFITLYSRAFESNSKNPILIDEKSIEIVNKINILLSKSKDPFYRNLLDGKIPKSCIKITALRSKLFDDYVKYFVNKNQNPIVVNFGCGLGTGYFRLNNSKIKWYDLDLPEIINFKKIFVKENNNYHFISSSVFDNDWIKSISKEKNSKFLFLGEGVFIYYTENEVKNLFLSLQKHFQDSEIIFDVNNSHMVKWIQKIHHIFLKKIMKDEIYYGKYFGKETPYSWGIKNEKEIEKWNSNFHFIDEKIYFDYEITNTWLLKYLSFFKFYRKSRYIVHYKLG